MLLKASSAEASLVPVSTGENPGAFAKESSPRHMELTESTAASTRRVPATVVVGGKRVPVGDGGLHSLDVQSSHNLRPSTLTGQCSSGRSVSVLLRCTGQGGGRDL